MSHDNGLDRRNFLKAGAVALAVGRAPTQQRRLRTPLCDLLGIEYPILQSGMAPIGGVDLASAVSEAGGLGILGCAHVPPDEVRRRIRAVKERTNKPFGVNLLLHTQVWPPIDTSVFGDDVVGAVHAVLNRFRERLGLPAKTERPPTRPNHVPGAIEVILQEHVPVFSVGLGNPPRALVDRFHARGAKVIAMIASVEDATAVAQNGVDVIIAQGHEAGGHRSKWAKPPSAQHSAIGTMTLVPQVVREVDVPVVAAGGIMDGYSLVAALALGAQGALVGTRFIATREAAARDFYKQALVDAKGDATVVTDAFSGLFARVLRNTFTEEYAASGAPTLSGYVQTSATADIVNAAAERGDASHYPLWAGQGVGLVDRVTGAADVVNEMIREAHAALLGLETTIGT